jgi:hypothetical protein
VTKEIVMVFSETGDAHCLWTDEIDLHQLGECQVERASEVEYDPEMGGWRVYLKDGTVLPGSWKSRTEAIQAEVTYLQERM